MEQKLEPDIMAMCASGIAVRSKGHVIFYVNKLKPDRYISDSEIGTMIYHEIGHCFFGLNHNEQGFGIMGDTITPFYVEQFNKHHRSYANELLRLYQIK